MLDKKSSFLLELLRLNIIAFGSFELKSGMISPFYVDLRKIISVPSLLGTLAEHIANFVPPNSIDSVCGVPYAGIPMATVFAFKNNIPLVLQRKTPKMYGKKQILEGNFTEGQRVLLLEDTVTTGKSLRETVAVMEANGLIVEKIVAVIDRKQGGLEYLIREGYNAESIFAIDDILDIYLKNNAISTQTFKEVTDFLSQSTENYVLSPKIISYEEKITKVKNTTAKKLLQIAVEKQSNIILATDYTDAHEILTIAENMGNALCALKLHSDIIADFSLSFITELQSLARRYDFLLFEDRKFADIGHTQKLQLEKGLYKIGDWADMVTVHPISGERSFLSLSSEKNIGLVPVVQLSSEGNLINADYTRRALEITEKNASLIAGIVAQDVTASVNILKFIPGVHSAMKNDDKGQRYITPQTAFADYKADFIIVGRAILQNANPLVALSEYQKIAWKTRSTLL